MAKGRGLSASLSASWRAYKRSETALAIRAAGDCSSSRNFLWSQIQSHPQNSRRFACYLVLILMTQRGAVPPYDSLFRGSPEQANILNILEKAGRSRGVAQGVAFFAQMLEQNVSGYATHLQQPAFGSRKAGRLAHCWCFCCCCCCCCLFPYA